MMMVIRNHCTVHCFLWNDLDKKRLNLKQPFHFLSILKHRAALLCENCTINGRVMSSRELSPAASTKQQFPECTKHIIIYLSSFHSDYVLCNVILLLSTPYTVFYERSRIVYSVGVPSSSMNLLIWDSVSLINPKHSSLSNSESVYKILALASLTG